MKPPMIDDDGAHSVFGAAINTAKFSIFIKLLGKYILITCKSFNFIISLLNTEFIHMAPAMYPALPTLFYIKIIIIFGEIQESIITFDLPFNFKINLQKFITATPMDHNWCQFIF